MNQEELEVWNYPLFKHMSAEHDLIMTDSEMEEVIAVCLECERRRQESLERLKATGE